MPTAINVTDTGTLTANGQAAPIPVTSCAAVAIQIGNTWTGTLSFEGTVDNVTWAALAMTPLAGGAAVTSTTGNGTWLANVGALNTVRVHATVAMTGSATVTLSATSSVVSSLQAPGQVLAASQIVYPGATGALTGDSNFTRDSVTGALQLFDKSGDLVNFSGLTFAGRKLELQDGTAASPITEWGTTIQISRTENLTLGHTNTGSVNNGLTNSNAVQNDSNAALGITSINAITSQMQLAGIVTGARTVSTVSGTDAVGILAYGRAMTGAVGRGTGAFLSGIRDDVNGFVGGAEVRATNNASADSTFSTTGASPVFGLWVNHASTTVKHGGEAIGIGALSGAGSEWLVGLSFKSGSTSNADVQSNSSAARFALVNGSHTYGTDFVGGTFSAGPIRLPNATNILGRNAANSADVNLIGLDANNRASIGADVRLALNNTSIVFTDLAGLPRTGMFLASDNTFNVGLASTPASNGHLILFAAGVEAMRFNPGTPPLMRLQGSMSWVTDNAQDIGASTTTSRPRDVNVGRFLSFDTAQTGTAVGAAGAGSAPPASPALYANVKVGSTTYRVPLYN